MNRKIVIAVVAIGLIIAGVYAIKNVANQLTPLSEKTKVGLYGKWEVDTSQPQTKTWIDTANFSTATLSIENDSTATFEVLKQDSLSLAFVLKGDTLIGKTKAGVEQIFTYKLQDSLLSVKSLIDSSTVSFKQVK